MNVSKAQIVILQSDRTPDFVKACREVHRDSQIVVIIVPNNNKERYDTIKKIFCCEMAIPSQVVISRTLSKKPMLMSVCTKVGIQMAAKLGGVPWSVNVPPKTLMVIGYDTYHDSTQKGLSVGAFVSSTNPPLTKWFSKTSFHHNDDEMSAHFASNMKDGLKVYHQVNGRWPERIIVFRDGVGDGQIPHVHAMEVNQVKTAILDVAEEPLKLTFIIVSKRINTRFFWKQGPGPLANPPPGTIVDTVVTRPERYEFFLVSQSVRQGTVAPTNFNVVEDTSGWRPQHHQQLAYKLTHLYYNWMGTVRVPAPCQYAHKLAYLVGTSLHKEPHAELSSNLFYL
jgi:aubergine-like protein